MRSTSSVILAFLLKLQLHTMHTELSVQFCVPQALHVSTADM